MADENLVELEIAAFMGPHIKRARIALALGGILYVIFGYLDYGRVADARHAISAWTGPRSDELAQLTSMVNLAYVVVVSAIAAGTAYIILAAIAGSKTMAVFYVAAAIFVATSLLELYASDGALLTSFVWWMIAICLFLGFTAARKAEVLRSRSASV